MGDLRLEEVFNFQKDRKFSFLCKAVVNFTAAFFCYIFDKHIEVFMEKIYVKK